MILYTGTQGKWSSGVVVNMPPCHGGDRGFESHLDRHLRYISLLRVFFIVIKLSR